ncbi:MAG: TIGR04282 family arsenosugar biosynthesis glycosyltransferase [Opitutaceae bacterium]|nr:TIGR04282 family arsenosugar biosynthesis glycosyltransferase [Opitutaceae bacterium]
MPEKTTVVMMLRAPIAGEVKTRLAVSVGNEQALCIYRWLVERQIQEIPDDWDLVVYYTPAEKRELMEQWLGSSVVLTPQGKGGLGDRLHQAMETSFSQKRGKVIIIGGDCPGLTSAVLRDAGESLDAVDVVLGPAVDGGYTLIGMKGFHEELFADISWGSARVLEETIFRLKEGRHRFLVLGELEDVDDEASWRRAQQRYSVGL